MNRWLFKTEPSAYSFEKLVKEKRARWDGVKNTTAQMHLRAIRKGDAILIYHTGTVRAVVGLSTAVSDPYPYPPESKLVAVDIVPDRPVGPVTLAAIKADPAFKDFALVRIGRLSILPVPAGLWKMLCAT